MYQRLKTILLKFTVIVMVFSIMGIPSFMVCSACCHTEVVSLQVVATESFPKQQIKQVLNFISSFDVPCQHISTGIFPQLNFSLPLPYLDFSPPRAAIFLFVQLLL